MKHRNHDQPSAQEYSAMRAQLRRAGLLDEPPVTTSQTAPRDQCACGGEADFFAGDEGACRWVCASCFAKMGGDPE